LSADALPSIGMELAIEQIGAFLVVESDCVPLEDVVSGCSQLCYRLAQCSLNWRVWSYLF
jgi:hypothetical protein